MPVVLTNYWFLKHVRTHVRFHKIPVGCHTVLTFFLMTISFIKQLDRNTVRYRTVPVPSLEFDHIFFFKNNVHTL